LIRISKLQVHIPTLSVPGFEKVPKKGDSNARKEWEKKDFVALHISIGTQLVDYVNLSATINERIDIYALHEQHPTRHPTVRTQSFMYLHSLSPENIKSERPIDLTILLEDPGFQDRDYCVETTTEFSPTEGIEFLVYGRKRNPGYTGTVVHLIEYLLGQQHEDDVIRFSSSGMPRIQLAVRNRTKTNINGITDAYALFLQWANGDSIIKEVILNLDVVQAAEKVMESYQRDDENYPGLKDLQEDVDRTKTIIDTIVKDTLCKARPVRKLYNALQKKE